MQDGDERHGDGRDPQRDDIAHRQHAGAILVCDVLADDAIVQGNLAEDRHHHEERHDEHRPAVEPRRREEQRHLDEADADHQRLHVIAAHERAHQHLRERRDRVDQGDQRADADVAFGEHAQALVEHLRHRHRRGIEDHAAACGGHQEDDEDVAHRARIEMQADRLRLLRHRAWLRHQQQERDARDNGGEAGQEECGAPAPQVHQGARDDGGEGEAEVAPQAVPAERHP